jgi:hypothetical protein
MRVALVKQLLDVQGPWSGVLWKDTSPARLFDIWPGKLTYWDMTCLLKADWYIIPQQLVSLYAHDAVFRHPGRKEMVERYTANVTAPQEIPLEQYDIVITLDPILNVPKGTSTLFAYHGVEHWDQPYIRSMRRPIGDYDLFFAHMMDAEEKLTRVPQAISFPYMHDPNTARALFGSPKDDIAWVDWRALATLGMTEAWGPQNTAAACRLQSILAIPVRYRGSATFPSYSITDPPTWGEIAFLYLRDMARCKYYIAAGRIYGGGQGAADAAALDCICIGQADKAYHRLICHPEALCADMGELPRRVRRVVASSDLQAEILAWQDQALHEHFVTRPLNVLSQALEMKRRRLARGGQSRRNHVERWTGSIWTDPVRACFRHVACCMRGGLLLVACWLRRLGAVK